MMRSVTIIVRLSPKMNDQGTRRHVPVLEFQKRYNVAIIKNNDPDTYH
jgi:hypothetical protein